MNIEFSTHPEDRQVEQQLISIIQQIEEKNKQIKVRLNYGRTDRASVPVK